MKLNSKGSASVEIVIFTTMVIVFMMLPIMSFAIEKLIINICIDQIIGTMESALYDRVEAVDLASLSEGNIIFDKNKLETEFYSKLDSKVSDLVTLDLVDLEFYPYQAGDLPCTPGIEMNYDTLHVDLTVAYEFFLYRELIQSDINKTIRFHFDLEIPKNN